MNKIFKYIILGLTILSLVGCEEFQPVFTGKYPEPPAPEPVEMEANTTIAELKANYKFLKDDRGKFLSNPFPIKEDIIIKGQVTTIDKDGNFYRSLYIQDETGAIEIKIGKTGLYNDYKLGQWVYIKCQGLVLGNYRGMLNLGYKSPTEEYETSYFDIQYIIDSHVFKGKVEKPLAPKTITSGQLSGVDEKSSLLGKYVTINDVTYANETFTLIYINPNGDRDDFQDNAIFLDGEGISPTWGITTWAMSENKFVEYIEAGNFDDAATNSGTKFGDIKEDVVPSAYSVSQYFNAGGNSLQVRTSGYAKFSDTEIDSAILDGAKVSLTGILTIYDDKLQFTLISLDGVKK